MTHRYLMVAAVLVLAACGGENRTEVSGTKSDAWEAGFQGTEALSGLGSMGAGGLAVTHASLVDVRDQVQGQLSGGGAEPTGDFYQRGKVGSGD
jgi:hypothetical protein